jgi:hypothetical protein
MTASRQIKQIKTRAQKSPHKRSGGGGKKNEHATMHELDISELVPESQGSEAASEESDKNIKDPGDSPAIALCSTSLKPLAGELLGDAPGTEDEVLQQLPKRMRESGMTPEAVMRVCTARSRLAPATPSFHCHLTIM